MVVRCPLCPSTRAEQILIPYKVTARKNGDAEVGGLATYQCHLGHIFFVRMVDLLRPGAVMPESYDQQFGEH